MTPLHQILAWLEARDRRDMALASVGMALGGWVRFGGDAVLPFACLGALGLAIFRLDTRYKLIPDLLNIGVAVAGGGWLALSPSAALPRLICATGLLLALEGSRILAGRLTGRKLFGGGDVKLIAAAALWMDPIQMPTYLFAAALSGLVESLLIGPMRARPVPRALPFGRHLVPWLCLFALSFPSLHL